MLVGDSGVVHQNVNGAKTLHGCLGEMVTVGLLADVGAYGEHLGPKVGALLGDDLELLGMAGCQHQIAALCGQRFCGAGTNAGAGSGDNGCFSGKASHRA